MTAKPTIFFCTDFVPSDVRALIARLAPPEFDLIFAEANSEEERIEKAKQADYIIAHTAPVSRQMIEAAPKLRLIQKFGVGVDRIDVAAAIDRGVLVYYTPGVNAVAVAELVLALMLAVYRRLCVAHNALRAGRWLNWELRTGCYELWDKTVGIIGGGNVGRALARRLTHGFECRVVYCDKVRLPVELETELGMLYVPKDELLRQADLVSVHVPLTADTRGMIGRHEFSLMKRNAIFINTSRGAVVDEEALIDALQEGIIAGAGIDVYTKTPPDPNNPLLSMDNVVVSPHAGGSTVDTMLRTLNRAFSNIQKAYRCEPLPETDLVKNY